MSFLSPITHQLPTINRFGHYLGTIAVNNNAKDNSDTATPFSIPAGGVLLLCADADCFVSSEHSSGTIADASSEPMKQAEKRVAYLWENESKVAVKAGGAANVKVFLLATRG